MFFLNLLKIARGRALKVDEDGILVTVHRWYDRCMQVLHSMLSWKVCNTLYGDFNTYLYFIEVLSLIKIQQTPLFQFTLILANINLSSTPSFFWCYAHPSSVHLKSGDKMVLQQVISVSSSSPQVLWSYSGDFPPFKCAWGCYSCW